MNFDRFYIYFSFFLIFIFSLTWNSTFTQAQDSVSIEPWGDTLTGPTAMAALPDSHFIAIQKQGMVVLLDDNGHHLGDLLDISSKIGDPDGERGLLGIAVHPDFPQIPYIFLNHTDIGDNTAIVRYTYDRDTSAIDTASREVIISIEQPYGNHNGGCIAFGSDGYLYIGMGDGGSAGDPQNRAQDLSTLLGKMLRIDVDEGEPYGIPEDNPFIDSTGYRPEIWSYGWRNPWRFSFDRETGDMWVGDVGQGEFEEISFESIDSTGGLNYGWRCYEGNAEFDTSEDCLGPFVGPVLTRSHDTGDGSIIGGYRYRGPDSTLAGHYIFGDFISGNVYLAVLADGDTLAIDSLMNIGNIPGIASFAEDRDGNVYALSLNGPMFKIGSGDATDPDTSVCDSIPVPELVIVGNETDSSYLTTDSTYEIYVWYYSADSDQKEDFEVIDSISGYEFYPEEEGNYFVTVTDSAGCVVESEIVQVVLTHAVDALEFHDIQVFPNPVTDYINIRTSEVLPHTRIEIINSQGRMIRQQQTQLPGMISMQNLPSGMYFVKFMTQDKYHVAKIVKK